MVYTSCGWPAGWLCLSWLSSAYLDCSFSSEHDDVVEDPEPELDSVAELPNITSGCSASDSFAPRPAWPGGAAGLGEAEAGDSGEHASHINM